MSGGGQAFLDIYYVDAGVPDQSALYPDRVLWETPRPVLDPESRERQQPLIQETLLLK